MMAAAAIQLVYYVVLERNLVFVGEINSPSVILTARPSRWP
jgi:hypothetical protein